MTRERARAPLPDWRRFYNAAITTRDPECLDFIIDEATKALDRRLDELGKLPKNTENLKESEEIIFAAKRLLMLRVEAEAAAEEQGS
jgi:hypothetical protein